MTASVSSVRPEYARIRVAFAASVYFRELPAASLDSLAAAATLQRWKTGGLLHGPGSEANRFWLVLSGGLLVFWVNGSGVPVPVAMIGEGSFYSSATLAGGVAYQTECRAERDTDTAVIEERTLRELQDSDAHIRVLVPQLILKRFHAATALYADLVSTRLPQRLARRLLAQALTHCEDVRGKPPELRLSQSDLATMLGSSRSKVNAELRRLEKAGLVRLGYRRLQLLDCERLCAMAGDNVPAL